MLQCQRNNRENVSLITLVPLKKKFIAHHTFYGGHLYSCSWKHDSTMPWINLTRQSHLSQCHLTVPCVYAELSTHSQRPYLLYSLWRPIHRPNVRFTIWDRMNSERSTSKQTRLWRYILDYEITSHIVIKKASMTRFCICYYRYMIET